MTASEISALSAELISLRDQVVVITGAAGGQGRAHARLLHGLGASLVLTDVDDAGVAALAEELETNVVGISHDVSSAEGWRAVVQLAGARFGHIDVLVNNAGYSPVTPFIEIDEASLRRTLDINLIGPFLGMQAVLPLMRERGGSIINVASTAALAGAAGRAHYAASKWGLRGLSRTVALEYGQYGIRVNSILPGAVDTPMITEATRAGEGFIASIPIPRAAQPDEISRVVVFLASSLSSYCTGQDFVVDGGATA